MDTNREKWIQGAGTGTVGWQHRNTLVVVSDDGANRIEFDHQGSGKVRVTSAGRDGFCRRGEERIMAVGNDGDDIVLYG